MGISTYLWLAQPSRSSCMVCIQEFPSCSTCTFYLLDISPKGRYKLHISKWLHIWLLHVRIFYQRCNFYRSSDHHLLDMPPNIYEFHPLVNLYRLDPSRLNMPMLSRIWFLLCSTSKFSFLLNFPYFDQPITGTPLTFSCKGPTNLGAWIYLW